MDYRSPKQGRPLVQSPNGLISERMLPHDWVKEKAKKSLADKNSVDLAVRLTGGQEHENAKIRRNSVSPTEPRSKRGKWSSEEDSVLMQFVEIHGVEQLHKLSKLGLVKRSARSCRDRYGMLESNNGKGGFQRQNDGLARSVVDDRGQRGERISREMLPSSAVVAAQSQSGNRTPNGGTATPPCREGEVHDCNLVGRDEVAEAVAEGRGQLDLNQAGGKMDDAGNDVAERVMVQVDEEWSEEEGGRIVIGYDDDYVERMKEEAITEVSLEWSTRLQEVEENWRRERIELKAREQKLLDELESLKLVHENWSVGRRGDARVGMDSTVSEKNEDAVERRTNSVEERKAWEREKEKRESEIKVLQSEKNAWRVERETWDGSLRRVMGALQEERKQWEQESKEFQRRLEEANVLRIEGEEKVLKVLKENEVTKRLLQEKEETIQTLQEERVDLNRRLEKEVETVTTIHREKEKVTIILKDRDEAIGRLRQEKEICVRMLKERDERIANIRQEKEDLNRLLKKEEGVTDLIQQEKNKLQKTLKEQGESIASLRQEKHHLNRSLKEKEELIGNVWRERQERDNTIRVLKEKVDMADAVRQEQEQDKLNLIKFVKDKEETINSLMRELQGNGESKVMLREKEKHISVLQQEVDRLVQLLKEGGEAVAAVQQKNGELSRQAAEMEKLATAKESENAIVLSRLENEKSKLLAAVEEANKLKAVVECQKKEADGKLKAALQRLSEVRGEEAKSATAMKENELKEKLAESQKEGQFWKEKAEAAMKRNEELSTSGNAEEQKWIERLLEQEELVKGLQEKLRAKGDLLEGAGGEANAQAKNGLDKAIIYKENAAGLKGKYGGLADGRGIPQAVGKCVKGKDGAPPPKDKAVEDLQRRLAQTEAELKKKMTEWLKYKELTRELDGEKVAAQMEAKKLRVELQNEQRSRERVMVRLRELEDTKAALKKRIGGRGSGWVSEEDFKEKEAAMKSMEEEFEREKERLTKSYNGMREKFLDRGRQMEELRKELEHALEEKQLPKQTCSSKENLPMVESEVAQLRATIESLEKTIDEQRKEMYILQEELHKRDRGGDEPKAEDERMVEAGSSDEGIVLKREELQHQPKQMEGGGGPGSQERAEERSMVGLGGAGGQATALNEECKGILAVHGVTGIGSHEKLLHLGQDEEEKQARQLTREASELLERMQLLEREVADLKLEIEVLQEEKAFAEKARIKAEQGEVEAKKNGRDVANEMRKKYDADVELLERRRLDLEDRYHHEKDVKKAAQTHAAEFRRENERLKEELDEERRLRRCGDRSYTGRSRRSRMPLRSPSHSSRSRYRSRSLSLTSSSSRRYGRITRSRSRSRSQGRAMSRSRSRSQGRSLSPSQSKGRSLSRSQSQVRSGRSLSCSQSRGRSMSHSKSRDRSMSRSPSQGRSLSRSCSQERSMSCSPPRVRSVSCSRSPRGSEDRAARSRHRSSSEKKRRSMSPSGEHSRSMKSDDPQELLLELRSCPQVGEAEVKTMGTQPADGLQEADLHLSLQLYSTRPAESGSARTRGWPLDSGEVRMNT